MSEMALGIRHQFDLAGVALAMGSAGLSSEIKIANPLERSIVADLGVAAMGGVVRGRVDVENLAIQLISDSARYAVQQSYANSSVSDEYHQSQKASHGEGHITQTTVDQQWESHLINDAEFTANTPLPSVTLDVNNSYVSQQLGQRVGEEVSHFYHPTPPPARNPNGFWRGVDNVLEMQKGTRKFADLFFTGHYEAPRDSWERAGFVIGAPIALSLGAERLGAEAINTLYQGSQQLGKGLMQASRLMNRWGLFGHNGAESSVLRQTGAGNSTRSADEAYNAIRASKTDITKIAKNTGIKPQNIVKVKNHLFLNKHLLDKYVDFGIPAEFKVFDSDIEIANSWARLESGNFTETDIQLLRHETAEAWYMRRNGPGYTAAHNAADARYPAPDLENMLENLNGLNP